MNGVALPNNKQSAEIIYTKDKTSSGVVKKPGLSNNLVCIVTDYLIYSKLLITS